MVALAKKHGLFLRQSYQRVGKFALMAYQRYAHAKQFERAKRELRKLRTILGRVERDIARKIRGKADLRDIFLKPLWLAGRVREQRQNQRGRKVYSLHAPEVECIGKGKAHRPYEFGVKVSVATTLHRSKGGQFVTHVKALPGNPYDGHTLETVIPAMESQIGANLARIVADRGYRGHNAPQEHQFRVYISGQKRRVTEQIKRELRRRSAVEPVIGHIKSDHRMGRNHLAHAQGDAINAVLAAAGYNFRRRNPRRRACRNSALTHRRPGLRRFLHGRLKGDHETSEAAAMDIERCRGKLASLQALLYAEKKHAILIVRQAPDAGGDDGAVKHVFTAFNPQASR